MFFGRPSARGRLYRARSHSKTPVSFRFNAGRSTVPPCEVDHRSAVNVAEVYRKISQTIT
jgi:hypothetical protein